jgi:RNA 2',3'-cyclic 3'-phosphodiesterase
LNGGAELRRAFLAVVPPPSVIRWTESVAVSSRQLDDGLRWSRSEQRHLTVRFFGAVAASAAVSESVSESFLRIPPFTLSLGGGGAFPDPRRASVLWLGVREGSNALSALAAAVAEPDDQPFRAHVTLARAKRPRDLRQVIDAFDASGESEPWTVDEVVLFESDRRPEGAVHTEQARFALGTRS